MHKRNFLSAGPAKAPQRGAMKTLILIPARLAATRLPNKPLADIGGTAMIVRVYQRAVAAAAGDVAVAAGDPDRPGAALRVRSHHGGVGRP